MILLSKKTQPLFYYMVIFVIKPIIILIYIIPLILTFSSCSEVDQGLTKDEQTIYTMIIDSVFDETYKILYINDSTHSLVRYTIKNIFSETLFGKPPKEYYRSFFKEKNCNIDDDIVETFIENNCKQYYIPENYQPGRDHKFVNYLSIYYYLRAGDSYKNKLAREIRDNVKFGLISLSRVGFNTDHNEALIEVNIHRKQLKEIFYSHLKKTNGTWRFSTNCYLYGPFKINKP